MPPPDPATQALALVAQLQGTVLDLEARLRATDARVSQLEAALAARPTAPSPASAPTVAQPRPAPRGVPASPKPAPVPSRADASPPPAPAPAPPAVPAKAYSRPAPKVVAKPPRGRAPLPPRPEPPPPAPPPVLVRTGRARPWRRIPVQAAAQPVTASRAPTTAAQATADADAAERERILAALKAANWNRKEAAASMGMPRRTWYRHAARLGVLEGKG